MTPKPANDASDRSHDNIDKSINIFDNKKSKLALTFDIIKWLVGIAFLAAGIFYAAIFETKSHANDTFVKKEVQEEVNKKRDGQFGSLEKTLERIENKIDRHMNRTNQER